MTGAELTVEKLIDTLRRMGHAPEDFLNTFEVHPGHFVTPERRKALSMAIKNGLQVILPETGTLLRAGHVESYWQANKVAILERKNEYEDRLREFNATLEKLFCV